MFGAMISGFATGVAIAAVIVFALMMWMSRPKAPETPPFSCSGGVLVLTRLLQG